MLKNNQNHKFQTHLRAKRRKILNCKTFRSQTAPRSTHTKFCLTEQQQLVILRIAQQKIIHLKTSRTRNPHIHTSARAHTPIYTRLNAFENVISAEMIEFDVCRSGDLFDEAGRQEELQQLAAIVAIAPQQTIRELHRNSSFHITRKLASVWTMKSTKVSLCQLLVYFNKDIFVFFFHFLVFLFFE